MKTSTFFKKFVLLSVIATNVAIQDINTCLPNEKYVGSAPDAADSTLFHFCDNGEFKGSVQTCEFAWLKFDIYDLTCKPSAITFPALEPSCTTINGRSKVPSKEFCRQYYNCENEGQLEKCPDDMPFFDYRQMNCQAESDALLCYPTSSKADPSPPTTTQLTEEPTTETEAPTTTTEPPTTTAEPITTTIEPTTVTEPVITTITEEPSTSTLSPINTCQPNLGFPDALPHPTDCHKRVFCEEGEQIDETLCPNGWIFDYIYLSCIATGNCYPGESISCTNQGTDPRPFVPHPKYCRQYYDCTLSNANEQKVGRACQQDKPFFDYRTMTCGTTEETLCYPGTTRDIPPPPDKASSFYYNSQF